MRKHHLMYSINAALEPFAPQIDHYFIQCVPVQGDAVEIEAVVFVYDSLPLSDYHLLIKSVKVELAIQMETDLRQHSFGLGEDTSYWEYGCKIVTVPYVN